MLLLLLLALIVVVALATRRRRFARLFGATRAWRVRRRVRRRWGGW